MQNVFDELFEKYRKSGETLGRIESKVDRLHELALAQWVTQTALQFKITPKEVMEKLKESLDYLKGKKK